VKMAIRTPSPMSSLRASGSSTKAEAPPFSLSLPLLVVVCSGIAVEVSTLSSWSWPASSGAVSLHNRPRDEDGEERDGGLEVSRETHCAGASAPPVSPNGIVGRSVAAVAAPEGLLSVYDMRIDRSAFAIILLLSDHLSEPLFQPSIRFDLISPLCSALLVVRHRVFTRGQVAMTETSMRSREFLQSIRRISPSRGGAASKMCSAMDRRNASTEGAPSARSAGRQGATNRAGNDLLR
jgi:hypothetical protein